MPRKPRSGIPIGLGGLGSARLSETPLDVIGDAFRDALAWFRSEPQDVLTAADQVILSRAGEAVRVGDLNTAVSQLRQLVQEQHSRMRRGLVRKAVTLIRKRRSPTVIQSLLAVILNYRAVKKANEAIERFQQGDSEDMTERLRRMAKTSTLLSSGPLVPDLDAMPPDVRRLFRGREDLFAEIAKHQSYASSGTCDFCGSPAIGELRQTDGKSWKLCAVCARNGQKLLDEQKRRQGELARALKESQVDLQEALTADRACEPAHTNLRTCVEILGRLGA
jgi:hypothetical protein